MKFIKILFIFFCIWITGGKIQFIEYNYERPQESSWKKFQLQES